MNHLSNPDRCRVLSPAKIERLKRRAEAVKILLRMAVRSHRWRAAAATAAGVSVWMVKQWSVGNYTPTEQHLVKLRKEARAKILR